MKILVLSKKRIIITLIGAAVLIYVLTQLTRTDLTKEIENQAVTRGDVTAVVSESGVVKSAEDVSLAFERGGRVASVPVQSGTVVAKGDVLVALDTTGKKIELAAAHARLQAEEIRLSELIRGADTRSLGVAQSAVDSVEVALQNAQDNLEKVTAQQNQLVENAHRTLFSSGLAAYLDGRERGGTPYSYTPPTITGTYAGEEEGVYTISLYNSDALSGASFRLTGMETGVQSISTVNPQPLGTRGLYIQFPENFIKGTGIVWKVSIPNTRSSSYQANVNAYNAAREARDLALKAAEGAVRSAAAAVEQSHRQLTQTASSARDERVEAQQAVVNQMSAAVQSIQFELDLMTLRAPFSGVVTGVTVEEGEIISPSAPAVSLISDKNFELVVNIPESDIREINNGDIATVIFDAYDDATFGATVTAVAPSTKLVDGVRVFEVTLQFNENDDRIRAGLSADINIVSAERHGVLVVPSRAVVEREDGKFVRTLEDKKIVYHKVETGLRGSDGKTEILSGINEGQEIITFAREDIIKQLEAK